MGIASVEKASMDLDVILALQCTLVIHIVVLAPVTIQELIRKYAIKTANAHAMKMDNVHVKYV